MRMLVKNTEDCEEFVAMDGTRLREILHRKNDDIDLRFSLAYARVGPRDASLPHRLRTTEVYYILKGKGIVHIDGEQREVKEGSAVYIPPGAVQYIENIGDVELEFLCIVDPAWRPEDEEIIEQP